MTREQLINETKFVGIASLWSWGTNYDWKNSPFALFLDLIGYSEDEIGEAQFEAKLHSLGFVEIGKLAEALTEYANAGLEAYSFTHALLMSED